MEELPDDQQSTSNHERMKDAGKLRKSLARAYSSVTAIQSFILLTHCKGGTVVRRSQLSVLGFGRSYCYDTTASHTRRCKGSVQDLPTTKSGGVGGFKLKADAMFEPRPGHRLDDSSQ